MGTTKIYATIEDGPNTLIISGPLRLLSEFVASMRSQDATEPAPPIGREVTRAASDAEVGDAR